MPPKIRIKIYDTDAAVEAMVHVGIPLEQAEQYRGRSFKSEPLTESKYARCSGFGPTFGLVGWNIPRKAFSIIKPTRKKAA